MEKDSGRYCYEPYQLATTLKRTSAPNPEAAKGTTRCRCFGGKRMSRTKAFFTGLATNLGICVLLFGYTLIGSVIFLAIEGGNPYHQSTTQILATTSSDGASRRYFNGTTTAELRARNEKARAKTVENIWDITVSLNILYRDNWTKLAAQEITRFQDELLKSLGEEINALHHSEEGDSKNLGQLYFPSSGDNYEWTFAKAFLYSLTVLTTIGYGSIAPRTTLGKAVTMGYAMLGIPLTLLYLSSIGSILSRVARGVFSRALCCCLCSNCGYCCYDEKRMAEKERKMRKKRQQMEMQQQLALQEPFYVRSNSNNLQNSPSKDSNLSRCTDESLSKSSMHGLSILAPILLCLGMMFIYICLGTFALHKLENWSLLDGFYFCFMSLTTIGFGDMVPGGVGAEPPLKGILVNKGGARESTTTIWFCSVYIMSGMALTAMCFNVVHDEIVHRLRHQEQNATRLHKLPARFHSDDLSNTDPYNMNTS